MHCGETLEINWKVVADFGGKRDKRVDKRVRPRESSRPSKETLLTNLERKFSSSPELV